MTTCPVCGGDLPAQRGPRARRYCSRACQAKAYRARQQQHYTHRPAAGDVDRLLAEYEEVPSLELADQLALAARRLAGALNDGRPADDRDLGVLARIPAVLTARAHQTAPTPQAPHGIHDDQAAETTTVTSLDTRSARQDRPATGSPAPGDSFTVSGTDTQASRGASGATAESPGIEPKPQKLAMRKARAIADAAELVKDTDYRDSHRWILRSGDTVIGYVEPSYGGTSRSGRNGWISRMGGTLGPRCKSRDGAALDLASRWIRVVTSEPRRTLTGDR
ncbi:hypothetical protein [Actinacidiphila glaucinigra]|uniref:hypothetical protein n=1 Tax=Actinacidiphila glaucinigra TaxID=235986 RepID=UPI00371ECA11